MALQARCGTAHVVPVWLDAGIEDPHNEPELSPADEHVGWTCVVDIEIGSWKGCVWVVGAFADEPEQVEQQQLMGWRRVD